MITLYTFGPYFGLPDPSPFVIKAMLLLKFAGLPFHNDESSLKANRVHDYVTAVRKGFARAPKGKLPYIDDAGTIVADSTFIRLHIEKKYGFDFDPGLGPEQKASAWAVEKMCEEHLYWALVAERWCNDENFAKGPAQFFFKAVPMPLRPLAQFMVRRRVGKKRLDLQGFGRHSRSEQATLAIADIDALATLLGDKAFLMGERPCGADAAVFGFVACFLDPEFTTEIRAAAEKHQNLVSYRDRILRDYFTG